MMLQTLPTAEVIARIETLQGVQKINPPTSPNWQRASAELKPLFAEMCRRQKAGEL